MLLLGPYLIFKQTLGRFSLDGVNTSSFLLFINRSVFLISDRFWFWKNVAIYYKKYFKNINKKT